MGFKVGDRVRVKRAAIENCPCPEIFLKHIGEIGMVHGDLTRIFDVFGHVIKFDNCDYMFCSEEELENDDCVFESVLEMKYPFTQTKGTYPDKQSEYNTTCQKCGSPAYQGFMKFECSNKECKV